MRACVAHLHVCHLIGAWRERSCTTFEDDPRWRYVTLVYTHRARKLLRLHKVGHGNILPPSHRRINPSPHLAHISSPNLPLLPSPFTCFTSIELKTYPSTYLLPCRDMSSTKTSTPVLPGSLILHFMFPTPTDCISPMSECWGHRGVGHDRLLTTSSSSNAVHTGFCSLSRKYSGQL